MPDIIVILTYLSGVTTRAVYITRQWVVAGRGHAQTMSEANKLFHIFGRHVKNRLIHLVEHAK